MKFGKVEVADLNNFNLPADHPNTSKILNDFEKKTKLNVYVGCAKYSRADLKRFYPRNNKDELTFYATQFNCIELNSTFYNLPSVKQIITWRDKTPDDFKFFPQVTNLISHYRRLKGADSLVKLFCENIGYFHPKLGMAFLELHETFTCNEFDALKRFIQSFPGNIPLAIELRDNAWFNIREIWDELSALLEEKKITNIILDTAGRRDLIHMCLTTPTAFIRFVGSNHPSDYDRLDEWIERLGDWINSGLENLFFFIRQNIEKESPLLSAYFIERLNEKYSLNIRGPGQRSLI